MNRIYAGTLGVVIMSAVVLAAPQKPAPADKGKTQTFVGCLSHHGSDGNYILLNAQEKGSKDKSKLTFVIEAVSPKMALEENVSREVEISGTVISSAPAKDGESPTLKATSLKFRAEYCGVPVPY